MGRGFDNIDLVFLPLSYCHEHRQQCMQYSTVQLINKLTVQCIITSPTVTMTSTTITDSNNKTVHLPSTPSQYSSSSFSSTEAVNSNNNNQIVKYGSFDNKKSCYRNRNDMHTGISIPHNYSTNNRSTNNCGNTNDDKTYWSPSCAALLAYHRLVLV